MPEGYQAERTISAVFKEQKQIDDVIRRLLNRGVPKDHISVMGRNFQSETRISGFITKRDVILGGLRTGAIFGSLFGSFLSLLTGVGVLFIPFVGPIVAAGPIGAVLLGAASGAIAGSAGAGLVSVFTAMGMPEDKAAVYQTRLQAGEFLLMVEIPSDRSGEFQLILESSGGEEMHTIGKALTHPCPGPCNSPEDLSPEVRAHLSAEAQQLFIQHYNVVLDETNDEFTAEQSAWDAVHQQFDEDENGVWSKQKVVV
ncbi:ChaB family protein [Sphaerospermopsis sp. LEGE 08334]|uniref:ChaB family protein n=1 Tax=Sphaerospermopsis sp. LEGE 08334 TaxID=1828651 RepID=UPI001882559D|nr:ChaB family protein [Sphaerospermopsis sp. LEGE 08334]MBE9054959.1 ChaB family protein [Sphaerospermopsis sp. LEGE 08334]